LIVATPFDVLGEAELIILLCEIITFGKVTTMPGITKSVEDNAVRLDVVYQEENIDLSEISSEVLVPDNEMILVQFDYPLENAVRVRFQGPLTKDQVHTKIMETYARIYKEEEETSDIAVVPLDQRVGLINRNTTNGKYGIWGHDLDELYVRRMYRDIDGVYYLGVDS
jgi:hypothetical protein